ncbi:MAG: acetyl-CoA carboxylase biotin carboxylase subunit [Candidatus Coatesbacteria bacterium]|nr:acetyl-CoA carboxylase biotin carboxylase subunit [Candidatus Coatesbacteria bacterium]
MFNKILIANRGEVALRVIHAARELGIRTVAVYSEADRESPHVREADEAVCIGPPPPNRSYLSIPRIIATAEITDADAIHPGYGFLAENPHFAEICEACQVTFIGPDPRTITMMGNKSRARQTMTAAGVPVVPGSEGVVQKVDDAIELAEEIGYPVIVKAVSGGGGRGMRIAHTQVSLIKAFSTAQTEAEAAFGDGSLYLEKFIVKPRHVEIQIMADKHGNVVHLGERDCSIQRRHQKLLEESPSPAVDAELRARMGEAAVEAARACGYHSAGTVEFLLDASGHFYFMEMNTRIQVEHPVTEMLTGTDLVIEQIRVAAGAELSWSQDEITYDGHVIECRINAEDPMRNFTPSPGPIAEFQAPAGEHIRIDTFAETGGTVSPYYDSLVAKLIVKGADRADCIARTRAALDELVIEGVKTTIPFHQALLQHPRFVAGDFDTGFLDEERVV